eukprot:gene7610-9062_t
MDYSPKIASSDLRLLSIFGWTLGGLFAVEWEDSPVGAYDEVAVLCALAWHPARPFAIGTWASHIFVSTPQACQGAREIWGLPAVSTSLEFSGGEEGEEAARRPRFRFSSSGAALSSMFEAVDGTGVVFEAASDSGLFFKAVDGTGLSSEAVRGSGWRRMKMLSEVVAEDGRGLLSEAGNGAGFLSVVVDDEEMSDAADGAAMNNFGGLCARWDNPENTSQESNGVLDAFTISLPSYSGCIEGVDPPANGLLQYPLQISGLPGISLKPAGVVSCDEHLADSNLQAIVSTGPALFDICIGRVRLTAGKPEAIPGKT